MKKEKLIQSLWAALIAFSMAFGSLGCMVTGLDILAPSRLLSLGLWCGVWALGLSAVQLLRFGPWSALVIALALAWHWFFGPLEGSVERLVFEVSTVYHQGYNWQVLYWSSDPTAGSLLPALRALALGMLWPVCACVTRRGSAWLAMPLALLPLGSTLLLTDTVPQTGYLLLYLFGVTVLLLTQGVRRRQTSQGNALSLRVALVAALALGLIFLLNPQKGYQKQALAQKIEDTVLGWIQQLQPEEEEIADPPQVTNPGVHIPAAGDTANMVDLENTGPRAHQSQTVMSVVASRTGQLYLRGASYAEYDGQSWRKGSQKASDSQWPVFSRDAPQNALMITTRKAHSVLYLPYYTPALQKMSQGRVSNSQEQTTYQLVYYAMNQAYLENSAAPAVEDSYTALPGQTQSWASEKALEILGGKIDPADPQQVAYAAQVLGEFVSNSAKYSLDTPRMPEEAGDFARWFIEQSDTGYCVHFATAATVLLRGAGVSARYVSGYSVMAKAEKSVNVVMGDAHAWVEYYVPGLGWMLLDPTPGSSISPQEPPVQTRPPDTVPDTTPEQTVPGETQPEAPVTTPPQLTLPGETAPQTEPGTAPTGPDAPEPGGKAKAGLGWLKYMLWPLAALALVAGQWQLRVRLRRRRLLSDRGNRRALAYWAEAERLGKLLGEKPPAEIKDLALKAKFSQHSLTREEHGQLRIYIADCEKRLKKHPWYLQALYRLVYALY